MEKALQLTDVEKEQYLRIPYDIFDDLSEKMGAFSRAELFVLAKIFTYSTIKGQPTARCRSKIIDFSKDFRLSERHVSRVIGYLLSTNVIEKVKDENGQSIRSLYRYVGAPMRAAHIRIDMYLLQTEFEFKNGERRYLTTSEALILAYMLTHCNDPKKRKFQGSIRTIAKKLKISPATVALSIHNLMKASLIFRPDKAKNSSHWTVYHANKGLLRKTKKSYEKEIESQSSGLEEQRTVVYVTPAVAAANAKADRERYYARLQEKANAPALQHKKRLEQDEQYAQAQKEVNIMQYSIAKAELDGDAKRLKGLRAQERRWQKVIRERMAALNISDEDLRPRYLCPDCRDSGFRSDGKGCTCYPKDEL